MAIAPCKECGKEVSSKAVTCPHCGFKQPKNTKALTIVICLLVVVLLVIALDTGDTPATAATPPDPQKELEFQQAVATLNYIKGEMKNPRSFELVSAVRVEGPAICVEYRGTNSFNAVVLQRHVMSENVNSSAIEQWNKICAGKTGENMMHARHAMQ
jgi:predicted nucleic acid-binding Zn ribbon protein